MIKKFLSALLAVLMVVSMVPLAAVATDEGGGTTGATESGVYPAKLHDTRNESQEEAAIADGELIKGYDIAIDDAGESALENGAYKVNKVVTIKGSDLQAHQNADSPQSMGYWVGVAFVAPEGAAKYKVASSKTNNDEKLPDGFINRFEAKDGVEGASQATELAQNIHDGKPGYAQYFDLTDVSAYKHLYIMIQWLKGDEAEGAKADETEPAPVVYEIKLEVTEDTGEVVGAPTNQSVEAVKNIKLDADVSPATDSEGFYEVALRTPENVKLPAHANANNEQGYWAGFSVVAPKGATKMKYAFGTTADSVNTLSTTAESLEANVDGKDNSGIAFYADAGSATPKKYAAVQWLFDDEGKCASVVTKYQIDLAGVKLVEPSITAVGYRDVGAKANEQIAADLNAAKGAGSASISDSDNMTMWVVLKDLMIESGDSKSYKVVVTGPNGEVKVAEGATNKEGPGTPFNTDTGYRALYWTFQGSGGTFVDKDIQAGEYKFQIQKKTGTGDSATWTNVGESNTLTLAGLTVKKSEDDQNPDKYYIDTAAKKTLTELGISISDPTPVDGKVFMGWKVGDEEEIIDSTALGSKVITKDTTVVAHLQEKQTAGFACGFEWNGDDANKAVNDAIKVAGKTEKNISDCIDQTYWLLVNEDMSSTDTKHAYEIKKGETVLQQGTITGGSGKTGVVYFSFMGIGHNSQNVSVKEGDQLTFVLYPSDDKSAEAETKPFTILANPLSITSAEVTSIAEKKVNVKFSEDLYGRYVIEVKKGDEVYATASTECDRGNGDADKINKGEGITLTATKPFSSGEYTAAIRPNITGAPDIATKTFNVTVSTDATIKSVEIGAAAIGDIPAAGTLAAPAEIKATFPANEALTGKTVKLTLNDPTATVKVKSSATAPTQGSDYDGDPTSTEGAVVTISTVDLSEGKALYIMVTAQDGETDAFYKVTAETSTIAVAPIPSPSPVVDAIPTPDQGAVTAAGSNTKVADASKETLTSAALAEAEKDSEVDVEAAKAALDASIDVEYTEGTSKVNIYVVPTVEVKPTEYKKETIEGVETVTSYTVDITPKAIVYATTADLEKSESVVLPGEGGTVNSVKMKEIPLTSPGKDVTIEIGVPSALAENDDKVYIIHKNDNGTEKERFLETVASGKVSVTVGSFSPFTITKATEAVLSELTVSDGTLSPAFDPNTTAYNVSVPNSVSSITVTGTALASLTGSTVTCTPVSPVTLNEGANTIKVKVSATGMADKEYTITVTRAARPVTPVGPSGPSTPTTYAVKVSAAENGKVSASATSAAQGATVTLTVTPDEGYELDKLTVTDASGKAVAVTGSGSRYTFTMPGSAVTVSASFKKAAPWQNPFGDVKESAWYYDAVKYVKQNKLMNGNEKGQFEPDKDLTRAEFAAILYNKEGQPATTWSNVFTDVPEGAWFAKQVVWAADKNILAGYGNGKAGPNDPVKREELAVLLWKYEGRPAPKSTTLNFPDAGKVSSWARDAMLWATENGVINGTTSGGTVILAPQGSASRAESAQMLMNYFGKK